MSTPSPAKKKRGLSSRLFGSKRSDNSQVLEESQESAGSPGKMTYPYKPSHVKSTVSSPAAPSPAPTPAPAPTTEATGINAGEGSQLTNVLSEGHHFVTADALDAKVDIIIKLTPGQEGARTAGEHLNTVRSRGRRGVSQNGSGGGGGGGGGGLSHTPQPPSGFVVPALQPDFIALHMGPKIMAKLAHQLSPEVYRSMNKVVSLRVQLAQKATVVLATAGYNPDDILLAHDKGIPRGSECLTTTFERVLSRGPIF